MSRTLADASTRSTTEQLRPAMVRQMVEENRSDALARGVQVEGLSKRYGDLWALRDVDFVAEPGTILGLLGHNGAGKTTAIKILTTLARPTEGRAFVAGFDVVTRASAVRSNIGLTAQTATVDGLLSARRNLAMVAKLYHMPRALAKRRVDELLERVDLVDAADRLVKTFSGGMRRRLDLAASIVASPPVLFLDEPTTGLDPKSRNELWALLRELVADGATLVLTTQYLDEADQLADDIVLLDHGRVAAHGTPNELKARVGSSRLELELEDDGSRDAARAALAPLLSGEPVEMLHARTMSAPLRPGVRLIEVVRALDAAGVDVHEVNRHEPTLDDVFLTLTGVKQAEEGEA